MLWETGLLHAPAVSASVSGEAEEQRKAAEERQRRMERIKRRKAQGLQDRYLYDLHLCQRQRPKSPDG